MDNTAYVPKVVACSSACDRQEEIWLLFSDKILVFTVNDQL